VKTTPRHIIEATAETVGVDPVSLAIVSRCRLVAYARRLAARVMRDELNMSYPEIARSLGMRSHASVHRSLNKYAVDPIEVELVAVLAKSAAGREAGLHQNPWAWPAVPWRWLVASSRKAQAPR
jgi:hypothetical protein